MDKNVKILTPKLILQKGIIQQIIRYYILLTVTTEKQETKRHKTQQRHKRQKRHKTQQRHKRLKRQQRHR